ncbi:MAG: YdcH family protein [Proteobacteria bacterium]|nr:YdcH family protein [Pseudomonadota bacterium]
MTGESFDDVTSLRQRLDELRLEHRDLDDAIARLADDAIARLADDPVEDELMLRRLKKRKLALKDRIVAIEHMLDPDEYA